MVLFMRDRRELKVDEWVKDLRSVKERKKRESAKNIADLSKEIAGYFQSKAKGRKYFY